MTCAAIGASAAAAGWVAMIGAATGAGAGAAWATAAIGAGAIIGGAGGGATGAAGPGARRGALAAAGNGAPPTLWAARGGPRAASGRLALGLAGAHHRLAHLAHHRADVGEVEVDETRHDHQVGDAAHAHVQHVVGHLEGVGEGRLLVGDLEQVLVGNDDQRVDHLLQFQDALLGRLRATASQPAPPMPTTVIRGLISDSV